MRENTKTGMLGGKYLLFIDPYIYVSIHFFSTGYVKDKVLSLIQILKRLFFILDMDCILHDLPVNLWFKWTLLKSEEVAELLKK